MEGNALPGQAGQTPCSVGNDQNVATAILLLLVMGEPAFFFQQTLDEVRGALGMFSFPQ